MVIIGYQGIGKSTLSCHNAAEGCYTALLNHEWFKVDNYPIENFYDIIKNIADHLKTQQITTAMELSEYHRELLQTKMQLSDRPIFIDFESGNFWVNGVRSEVWAKVYAKVALELSLQGFDVFTSSHKVVRDALYEYSKIERYYDEEIVCVYPSLELKEEWIDKLEKRSNLTNLEKDRKAYLNAKEMYDQNIADLKEGPFDIIYIGDMQYDLLDAIKAYIEDF